MKASEALELVEWHRGRVKWNLDVIQEAIMDHATRGDTELFYLVNDLFAKDVRCALANLGYGVEVVEEDALLSDYMQKIRVSWDAVPIPQKDEDGQRGLRKMIKEDAEVIGATLDELLSGDCPEREIANTKLEEVVMWVNKWIKMGGLEVKQRFDSHTVE